MVGLIGSKIIGNLIGIAIVDRIRILSTIALSLAVILVIGGVWWYIAHLQNTITKNIDTHNRAVVVLEKNASELYNSVRALRNEINNRNVIIERLGAEVNASKHEFATWKKMTERDKYKNSKMARVFALSDSNDTEQNIIREQINAIRGYSYEDIK